jgi:hypothetical protein
MQGDPPPAAYFLLGMLALLLGLPLSWRYIVERGPAEKPTAPASQAGLTWQEGARSFPFWIIVAVLFVSSISMNGAIIHLSALLTDRGISPGEAALCIDTRRLERAWQDHNRLAARPNFRCACCFYREFDHRRGHSAAGKGE